MTTHDAAEGAKENQCSGEEKKRLSLCFTDSISPKRRIVLENFIVNVTVRSQGCHESCSECSGPSQQECSSCSDPAALINNGECVPDCGADFYSQEGVCYACDSSCASCFPDNPKCMSCPPGTLMHHGKCIPQCPTHHYQDNHSRCRACHSSCVSCWGPSVSQCTLCADGLLLHQGQCVEACGEGLYSQDDTCQNCHPTCRSCVGPLSSDCLRCLKPEEVLLLQSSHLQQGVCTAGCSDNSFLDDMQTCRECSSDCQRCTADLQTGVGSVCLWCKVPRTWLLGDHCVSHCPQGRYGWHGACMRCHPSCESCSGAGPLVCTSCPVNSVLLPSGVCATKCPLGYYDNGHRVCQACANQCLTCDMSGVCTSCRDPTKVLLFGECQYDSCAHQYYLNATTRACRGMPPSPSPSPSP
ncbi:extracellular matrix protein FRAS1 [Scomber scombrus]|uniref:Extracellular matrix protein FRAS1 n=1 Tax=Scomber scombrus TaxID=13677 RepID=A0AAV1Q4C1_SCOSC